MGKYIICILLIWGCSNSPAGENITIQKEDTLMGEAPDTLSEVPKSHADPAYVLNILNNADSVILASHYSPNEPIKNEQTGKYLPSFKVVENGKLNESIIQERKKLTTNEIKKLGDILISPSVPDSISLACFQPRNGIFIYRSGELSYIDICFDCNGHTTSQNLSYKIVFGHDKYKKLFVFFEKHGFKYMF